ncbi:hypothetical protein Tco_0480887 [Tanacetum coccineum]
MQLTMKATDHRCDVLGFDYSLFVCWIGIGNRIDNGIGIDVGISISIGIGICIGISYALHLDINNMFCFRLVSLDFAYGYVMVLHMILPGFVRFWFCSGLYASAWESAVCSAALSEYFIYVLLSAVICLNLLLFAVCLICSRSSSYLCDSVLLPDLLSFISVFMRFCAMHLRDLLFVYFCSDISAESALRLPLFESLCCYLSEFVHLISKFSFQTLNVAL